MAATDNCRSLRPLSISAWRRHSCRYGEPESAALHPSAAPPANAAPPRRPWAATGPHGAMARSGSEAVPWRFTLLQPARLRGAPAAPKGAGRYSHQRMGLIGPKSLAPISTDLLTNHPHVGSSTTSLRAIEVQALGYRPPRFCVEQKRIKLQAQPRRCLAFRVFKDSKQFKKHSPNLIWLEPVDIVVYRLCCYYML